MLRSEMVARIAAETKVDTYTVDLVLDEFLQWIEDEIASGNTVRLTGFGNFGVIQRKATRRRNPLSREVIEVPARLAVRFHPSPILTEKINAAAPITV